MVNLKLFRDVFIILISLILIALAINYGYEKFKKRDGISEQNLDEIREQKQKEIDKKQTEAERGRDRKPKAKTEKEALQEEPKW